jgi:hypothetical protein
MTKLLHGDAGNRSNRVFLRRGQRMAGHVFIIRGDLTKLYCDAWIMPTSYSLHVRDHWLRGIPGKGSERGRKGSRKGSSLVLTFIERGQVSF